MGLGTPGGSAILAIPVGVLSFVLYLPFFAGFSSQAGGILPNLVSPTRGAHLWLCSVRVYSHFCLPGLPLAQGEILTELGYRDQPRDGYRSCCGGPPGCWVCLSSNCNRDCQWIFAGRRNYEHGLFFAVATWRRLASIGGWITQAAMLAFVVAFLARMIENKNHETLDQERPEGTNVRQSSSIHWFVLLLILIGSLLVLAPDYVFLRDLFGNRLNTVFKFYFLGWILWSMASAFGIALMLQNLNGAWKWIYRLGMGLHCHGPCFFAYGLPYNTSNFQMDAFRQNLEEARKPETPPRF